MVHRARPWQPASEVFASQPASLAQVVPLVAQQLVEDPPPDLGRASRVCLLGIGASAAAAASAVYHLRMHGIHADRITGAETPSGWLPPADLYVAVSQSGRSREIVEGARSIDASRRSALINAAASPLGDLCQTTWTLGDHSDSAPTMVGFTATLVGLGMLTDHWSGESSTDWAALPALVDRVINDTGVVAEFAHDIRGVDAIDVVSAASALSAAEVAVLLLREGPKVPTLGMETRSYLHGPMDSAGSTAHVVIGGDREARLVDELATRSPHLLFVTTEEGLTPRHGRTLRLPDPGGLATTVLQSLVIQRLTLALATELGRDVDQQAFSNKDTKVDSAGQQIS